MNEQDIRALIAEGETSTVEFKVNMPRQSEMAERLCGLANSPLGGVVIVGVEDKTWQVKGVTSPQDVIDDFLRAASLCSPVIPFVDNQPELLTLDGRKLVIARIPPNNGTLYQAGGAYWLRRGTHTRPMDTAQVAEYINRQGLVSWETQLNPNATLADLDMRKFERYIQHLSEVARRPSRITSPEELLVLLECAAWVVGSDGTRTLHPTNAGLLLFGESPRYFFPHAEIICTFYKDDSGFRRYDDRRIITGTITEQIDQTEAFLKLYTPIAARIEGFHRIDEPALPLEALREAVVNAVVHRDYSLKGEAIRLFYYSNRVEIHNPGLLMPGISLTELQAGRTRSKPRNPVLASILRDMPGGYMERVGTGIPFIINQMQTLGLPAPEFAQTGEFVVTFWRSEADRQVPITRYQSEEPPPPAPAAKSQPKIGRPHKVVPLTREERHKIALEHVRKHGYITSKQYQELNRVTENTAARDLDMLVEMGSLTRTGRGPSRRYYL